MQNLYENWKTFSANRENAGFTLTAKESEAAAQWLGQGFPQGEDWKYVNFGPLKEMELKQPSKKSNTWTETEDFYQLDICDFSGLGPMDSPGLPNEIQLSTDFESKEQWNGNPLAQSVLSFQGAQLNLSLQKSQILQKPIKIVFHLDSKQNEEALFVYHVKIALEENSQAQVFVEYQGDKLAGLSNIRVDLKLAPGAQLKMFEKEMAGKTSRMVRSLAAEVHRDASFSNLDITTPGLWSRHDTHVFLEEKGAETQLRGSYLNHSDYFSDHHTKIVHEVGETHSLEDYRGVLNDKARAVFNGKIKIAEGAKKSLSEQINKNLMLSEKAEVNTKPELQIYNDDVKAAHGATVGRLDDEQIFYLQSRGYSRLEAQRVLSNAFVYSLLDSEDEKVVKFFEKEFQDFFTSIQES